MDKVQPKLRGQNTYACILACERGGGGEIYMNIMYNRDIILLNIFNLIQRYFRILISILTCIVGNIHSAVLIWF